MMASLTVVALVLVMTSSRVASALRGRFLVSTMLPLRPAPQDMQKRLPFVAISAIGPARPVTSAQLEVSSAALHEAVHLYLAVEPERFTYVLPKRAAKPVIGMGVKPGAAGCRSSKTQSIGDPAPSFVTWKPWRGSPES